MGVAQEQARDGEAAVALTFLDAGLLQQVQGTATGAEEDELRVDGQGSSLLMRLIGVNGPGAVGPRGSGW